MALTRVGGPMIAPPSFSDSSSPSIPNTSSLASMHATTATLLPPLMLPTLVVSYGGLSGEYWWYARDNVWEDKKLARFFPRETLDARELWAKIDALDGKVAESVQIDALQVIWHLQRSFTRWLLSRPGEIPDIATAVARWA